MQASNYFPTTIWFDYKPEFLESLNKASDKYIKDAKKSKKEWDKLNSTIKEQFKKKLEKRLEEPIIPSDKLSGYENVYKIKI